MMNANWILLVMLTQTQPPSAWRGTPPPPPPVERVQPRAGFVWVQGDYEWRDGRWAWTGGHWEAERRGQRWQPGRWEQQGNRWVWIRGMWAGLPTRPGAMPPPPPPAPPPPPPPPVVVAPPPPPPPPVVVRPPVVQMPPPAPPPPPVVVQPPPPPRKHWVWIPGYQDWRDGHYVWIEGHWEKEHKGHRWHGGHWDQEDGRSVWRQGGWERGEMAMAAGPVSIVGRVVGQNGNPIPGVTVMLAGTSEGRDVTDGNGGYSFNGLVPGSYSVRPQAGHCSFGPDVVNLNNLNRSIVQDFNAACAWR